MSEASRWPLPSPRSEPVLTLFLAAGAAEASAWTNRFVVEQTGPEPQHADLAEDMSHPPAAKRMVVDPFDPLHDWKVGYDTETGHAGGKFDRLRAFAAPGQARCWLVGLPVPPVDLGGEQMPPLAFWTHLADEVLYIHQGKEHLAWRRPEFR